MAMQSSATRGFEVEDSAVILLEFVNGALGTINLSDTIVSPWSWELTSGENADYPTTTEHAYMIGGSAGAAVPNLSYGRQRANRAGQPINRSSLSMGLLTRWSGKLNNLLMLLPGNQAPLVNGADGLASLVLIEAVKQAAETGQTVYLDEFSG